MTASVLIVDDSNAMRAFVRATLEDQGDIEVVEAQNGFEALKALPGEDYHLVIIDINMPDINGLELISIMRGSERHRRTPLLIITTESSALDRERAMALGANGYLAKPFTPEQLLAAVAEIRAAYARG